MTDVAPTDIEIYVNKLNRDDAEAWLTTVFGTLQPQKKRKGMPKSAFPYVAQWHDTTFHLMIFEQVVPGYTSLWFDTTALPWPDDQACALAAADFFKKPARITAGSWATGSDPDAWIEIMPDGQSREIIWKE
ncbi:hypothetical protein [Reinekea blandensis]|uniref:Succinyl-diaminopimelate desuccinylase n=1 Tax=Reinekea blandensis MED297 TaxID=314283 RepID=A4BC12_9GAMM|nr:hypothetical protein [Reinekea blandensis]EAR10497.1 succinyl-diaminopimelate desuccinylase [Reinekea sp. MED297] [Reinekea blandensis MED297]